jgi:hypothetical protein
MLLLKLEVRAKRRALLQQFLAKHTHVLNLARSWFGIKESKHQVLPMLEELMINYYMPELNIQFPQKVG